MNSQKNGSKYRQAWQTNSNFLSADYWRLGVEELLEQLETSKDGLSSQEAESRIAANGYNESGRERKLTIISVFWNQIKSPLVLILFVAAIISGFSGDKTDTAIVLVILLGSAGIGFWREYNSNAALSKLSERIRLQSNVIRDGVEKTIPARELVPGDIIILAAGTMIPADAIVLESNDLFLDQEIVTGESFPVEKISSPRGMKSSVAFSERSNLLFQGTNVRSGTGRAIVAKTGRETTYASIVNQLSLKAPETEFDHGLKKFGNLLLSVMFIMVVVAFFASGILGHAPPESLMFAVALAVGLSPELLPAILTVNLARSANTLAKNGVLVRHLNAIENLGSMNVICTDKTGTLTKGVVDLHGTFDSAGAPSHFVGSLAYANAKLQKGLPNPLDQAILRHPMNDVQEWERLAEIPYDFIRKRLTIAVRNRQSATLITKGALDRVLTICRSTEDGRALAECKEQISKLFQQWSEEGIRVLGVASRNLPLQETYDSSDEHDFTFHGFVTFADQPKDGVPQVIETLKNLGVRIKIITGDNHLVAKHVANQVGIDATNILTGEQLDELRDEALWALADKTSIFAQVDPNQKERIILALRKKRNVVGYMGDGINDAPAMHAADTSISVETAADAAKGTADFVLTENNLAIIARGIEEGRKTFANTLKYILLTTSANLGNMISMAAASLFLPFLPLLPSQILLNNFLSNFPAFGLADDKVDQELIARPRRWNMAFVRRFMIEFGLLSSIFDFLTFAVLLFVFRANAELFRTAWFLESLLTELAATFTLRTRRRFTQSRPAKLLLYGSIIVGIFSLALPYSPVAGWFGFVRLPVEILAAVLGLAMVYVIATECAKTFFYRRDE